MIFSISRINSELVITFQPTVHSNQGTDCEMTEQPGYMFQTPNIKYNDYAAPVAPMQNRYITIKIIEIVSLLSTIIRNSVDLLVFLTNVSSLSGIPCNIECTCPAKSIRISSTATTVASITATETNSCWENEC